MADKQFSPEEVQQELGPGQYIKYGDMTIWDQPGEGGADLYVFAPAMTEDELMALEEQAGTGETAPPTETPPAAEPQA
jgi:hypothetical protein